jgi:hypothetical protein
MPLPMIDSFFFRVFTRILWRRRFAGERARSVGTNVRRDAGAENHGTAPALDDQRLAVVHAETRGETRMQLHARLGLGVAQRLDHASLRARVVVLFVAPRREEERVGVVRDLGRGPVRDGVKLGFARRMREAFGE